MNYTALCRILGNYLSWFSLALLAPLLFALYDTWAKAPQPQPLFACIEAFAICIAVSLVLKRVGRCCKQQIGRRESILLVALIWIVSAAVSALPFALSKTLDPIDAFFEAMSGLTTTGSTALCPKAYDPATLQEVPIHITNAAAPTNTYTYYGTIAPIRDPQTGLVLYTGLEAVSRALLFWRSFLQWLGGMGIVVLFLTVLPALGVGGKFLYQMETTGPFKDEISPRIHETASKLWKLYLFLTCLEIALLLAADSEMKGFDALCLTLSNISTGGFSIHNDSVAAYHNFSVECIVMAFMILGSISFSLYFHILRLKIYRLYVPDFFLFFAIAALGSIAVSLYLVGEPRAELSGEQGLYTLGGAFRDGTFQALSVQTSTGFVLSDYDRWPFAAQMILLLLMFVGGMSGSTSGGIKTSRFYILYKIVQNRLESLYRPDRIRSLRIGFQEVDDSQAMTTLSFFCIVLFFTVLGGSLYILDGIDPQTSLGLIACFLNNVGCAFNAAGPPYSMGLLGGGAKLLSCCWMLFGRLEYFVLLLLFLPSYWKGR